MSDLALLGVLMIVFFFVLPLLVAITAKIIIWMFR